jgi:branched-chain amino acid transport system substrate-binding protein
MIRLAAEALIKHQDIEGANRLLAVCAERVGDDVARDIADRQGSRTFRIGLVLPFTGDLQTWADDIHNGAVVAAELARPMRIELTTYDTEGDAVAAARIIADLNRKRSTHLAVGPLTSEAAAVATATLACGDLPLIVPAATQAGLTELAGSAFQLSPNIGLQGIRMAEYAVDSLRARTAGVVTSTSPDHLRMARAFAQRFERLGGKVAAIEYYRSRDKDFGPYIRDLKAVLLGHHPDSTFFVTPDGDTLDPDGVPAFLDCLYMPGSAQQLRLLLPQVRFYKLQGAYLGSDGWGDEAVYKLGDNVTRLAVFPSPFLAGGNSKEYLEFAAAYDARYGHQPPRLAALGYDAVRLAARAAGSDHRDREDLIRNMSQTRVYPGASGRITFGRNRENIEMPLYRIQGGQAVLLSGETAPGDTVGPTE